MVVIRPYFIEKEVRGLKDEFIAKIVVARKKTIELDPLRRGIPFRVSSGYRSLAKNESVIGAVPDSSHIKGLGLDVRVFSSTEVAIIIAACQAAGIWRIGIYVNDLYEPIHLHMDIDPDKVTPCIWVKKEQN